MALLGMAQSSTSASTSEPAFLSSSTSFFAAAPSEAQPSSGGPNVSEVDMLEDHPSTSTSQQSRSTSQHDASPSQGSAQHHSGATFAQSASAPGWEDDDSMDDAPHSAELAALPPQQAAVAAAVLTLLDGAGADTSLHVSTAPSHHLQSTCIK